MDSSGKASGAQQQMHINPQRFVNINNTKVKLSPSLDIPQPPPIPRFESGEISPPLTPQEGQDGGNRKRMRLDK